MVWAGRVVGGVWTMPFVLRACGLWRAREDWVTVAEVEVADGCGWRWAG